MMKITIPRRFALALIALFAGLSAYAQTSTITGVVRDTAGDPIVGAAVMVKTVPTPSKPRMTPFWYVNYSVTRPRNKRSGAEATSTSPLQTTPKCSKPPWSWVTVPLKRPSW